MKKILSYVLALVLIISAVPIGTFTFTVDAETEGYYTYMIENDEATITGCDISISGDIVIPDTLGGYPVTSIGQYAFCDRRNLTSITIPNSVTSIGQYAFYCCTSIKNITIPASVNSIEHLAFYCCTSLVEINVEKDNKFYSSVDGVLFNKHKTKLIQYPTGSVDKTYSIPEGVIHIDVCAFYSCDNIISIFIPDSIIEIGGQAFMFCENLASITIPNSVENIGGFAFADCKNLLNVSVGNGVCNIGSWAFNDCDSLTSITIPNSVVSIGDAAFYSCDNLTNISLGKGIKSIGEETFFCCNSLTSVYYGGSQEDRNNIVVGGYNDYLLNAMWHYNYNLITPGELNGDGAINNRDLALLMQYLNGWEVEITVEAADVNADGEANNRDYAILMQYVNGWEVELQ